MIEGEAAAAATGESTVLLSVVVPVFNQASEIVANVEVIRQRIAEHLDAPFEIVVVSDGSIDATEAELVEKVAAGGIRVFHYDRNLGKGYAVKLGALEAVGEWVGFVDADLDLDPADLAAYVRRGQEHRLDFVIGSKRHPGSHVEYPRSRVVASWCFQQFVRLLFRFDVRDTQVGLKVFRREVAEQVLPMLLVKRYAFDIELLAVGRAFGFGRIEEMPIRLDYRFTGSGVRSRAVLRALVDTAAIFYRLRILHYYQRRRAIAGAYGWTRPRAYRPLVSVLVPPGATFRELDYTNTEVIPIADGAVATVRAAAHDAQGEILAILEPGARATANWLSATVPFLSRSELVAVVTPKLAPLSGSVRARAASAIGESRFGTGLGYFRFTPGNMRYVRDFPAPNLVVRTEAFRSLPAATGPQDVVQCLAQGGSVLYSPEAIVVVEPPPLFTPHLDAVFREGRRRGGGLRQGRFRQQAPFRIRILVLVGFVALLSARFGGAFGDVVAAAAVVYVLALAGAVGAATLRFQSFQVGALALAGIVCTHVTYGAGLVAGLAAGRSR